MSKVYWDDKEKRVVVDLESEMIKVNILATSKIKKPHIVIINGNFNYKTSDKI